MKNKAFEIDNHRVLEVVEQDYPKSMEDISFGNHFMLRVKKSGILLALVQKTNHGAFEQIKIRQWGLLYKYRNGKQGIGSLYRKQIIHKIKSQWETK